MFSIQVKEKAVENVQQVPNVTVVHIQPHTVTFVLCISVDLSFPIYDWMKMPILCKQLVTNNSEQLPIVSLSLHVLIGIQFFVDSSVPVFLVQNFLASLWAVTADMADESCLVHKVRMLFP